MQHLALRNGTLPQRFVPSLLIVFGRRECNGVVELSDKSRLDTE